MRLTKYKRHLNRHRNAYNNIKQITPLKTGGRIHVHEGRVHKGAGFEGKQASAGEKIRDIVSMHPIGAVLRVVTDAIIPEDKRKPEIMGVEGFRARRLKKQGGVLTRKQERYLLTHPDDSAYYDLAVRQVKKRIARKRKRNSRK